MSINDSVENLYRTIERLKFENDLLKGALKYYSDYSNFYSDGCRGNDIFEIHPESIGDPSWPQYHEREETMGWLANDTLDKIEKK